MTFCFNPWDIPTLSSIEISKENKEFIFSSTSYRGETRFSCLDISNLFLDNLALLGYTNTKMLGTTISINENYPRPIHAIEEVTSFFTDDYDITIPFPKQNRSTVKVKIKSIKKFSPKISL